MLDRSIVKEVVCALCDVRQPIAAECTACGVAFGAYACTRCPFYDDNLSKRPFHCDDCGLCRVGGRERYFHCKTCGSCYSLELRGAHRCVERAMHANCPVCFEYLFDSTASTTVLSCGHTIHSDCLSVRRVVLAGVGVRACVPGPGVCAGTGVGRKMEGNGWWWCSPRTHTMQPCRLGKPGRCSDAFC